MTETEGDADTGTGTGIKIFTTQEQQGLLEVRDLKEFRRFFESLNEGAFETASLHFLKKGILNCVSCGSIGISLDSHGWLVMKLSAFLEKCLSIPDNCWLNKSLESNYTLLRECLFSEDISSLTVIVMRELYEIGELTEKNCEAC